jgi:transposase
MDTDLRTFSARLLPRVAGVAVADILVTADALEFTLISAQSQAACPLCGTLSRRVHSRYRRTLADLPWAAYRVQCLLQVRRFRCPESTCRRRIFTERLPALVAPSARRTARLADMLCVLGMVAGGRPAVRLAQRLGLPVSLPSLLRLVRQSGALAQSVAPTAVGIDDFALRRNKTYGTVLVDLDGHRLLDLLPDRTAARAAAWFAERPTVEVVSRDRGGAYAEGARRGAPQARQTADRWHLLHNLTEALQRIVARHQSALRQAVQAVPLEANAGSPPPPTSAPSASQRTRRRQASTDRRQQRFDEVQRLQATGASVSAIEAELGIHRQTVRRYLRASGPPGDYRGRRRSQVARFDAYLRERWAAGEENVSALWRELRARGFTGGRTTVQDYVAGWRTVPGRRGYAVRGPTSPAGTPPPDRRMPSARQVTWWLLTDHADLEPGQRAIVAHLLQVAPAVQAAAELARQFGGLVRERRAADLNPWLETAIASGVPELVGTAESLRQDQAAVEAGLTLPYSNGQTEGQVTRIKLLKRQMYGRANFDLLRIRVLHHDSEEAAS